MVTSELTRTSTVTLEGGVQMPRLGLGTWRATGETLVRAVREALRVGYRHFDTASMYGNEIELGRALADSGLPREEVFVTSKVWNTDQGYDSTLRACEASLERLGMDHLDLYLIHWPVPDRRLDTWRALERLREEGLARAVGVSNYLTDHLEELLAQADRPPAANQIELHPFNFRAREEVVELCRREGVVVEAYSPLARGRRFDDPVLAGIAEAHGRTPAQVMVRWGLQRDFAVIPKSSQQGHLRENAEVFDFSLDEEEIAALDARDERLAVSWDPTGTP